MNNEYFWKELLAYNEINSTRLIVKNIVKYLEAVRNEDAEFKKQYEEFVLETKANHSENPKGYPAVTAKTYDLTFEEAISYMKKGKTVRRKSHSFPDTGINLAFLDRGSFIFNSDDIMEKDWMVLDA